jgi:hypothetical protein
MKQSPAFVIASRTDQWRTSGLFCPIIATVALSGFIDINHRRRWSARRKKDLRNYAQ